MGTLCLARDHSCECRDDVPAHHFDRGILIFRDNLVQTIDQQPSELVGNLSSLFRLLEQLPPLLRLATALTPGSIPSPALRRSLS